MAGGQATQRPGSGRATLAALALTALWHVAPAVASSNTDAACSDIVVPTLEISANELKKTVVLADTDAIDVEEPAVAVDVISPTRLRSPVTESAVPEEYNHLPASAANDEKRPPMNARVPGVSDEALSRYKRQMYRKDI